MKHLCRESTGASLEGFKKARNHWATEEIDGGKWLYCTVQTYVHNIHWFIDAYWCYCMIISISILEIRIRCKQQPNILILSAVNMLWKTVTLPSLYITISAWQAPSLQCLVANMEERKAPLWCCDFPSNQHTDDGRSVYPLHTPTQSEVNIYKSQTGAEKIANLPIHLTKCFGKTTGKIRYHQIIYSIFHQMAKWS